MLFVSISFFSIAQCPVSNIIVIEPTCNGACDGTLIINTTDGVGPYQVFHPGSGIPMPYTSMIIVTGLCSGSYTITVMDIMGCIEMQTVNIFEPLAVFVMTTSTPESFPGACDGTISATASGGTPGYTYNVSPFLPGVPPYMNVCAGTYNVSVTDSQGCESIVPIVVTTECAMVSNTNLMNATCSGACNGVATISSSGGVAPYTLSGTFPGAPLTFTSSAILQDLCAGVYNLTNTDANGCTENISITISEPSSITANAADTDAIAPGICDGTLSATVSGGVAPYTAVWINCSTGLSIGSGLNLTNVCAADYQIVITDANGCTASTDCINVSDTITNAGFEVDASAFKIYPNPVSDQLTIETSAENFYFEIVNTLGEVVYVSNSVFSSTTAISLQTAGLSEGLYVVRLYIGETISVKSLVILAQ